MSKLIPGLGSVVAPTISVALLEAAGWTLAKELEQKIQLIYTIMKKGRLKIFFSDGLMILLWQNLFAQTLQYFGLSRPLPVECRRL